jgi:hypothetical protein
MAKFDMRALQATLDSERRARKLTWNQLAAEISEPFRITPSIPISVSTLRTMAAKRSVTSAVVLQVLRWLRRTPESFLAGRDEPPSPEEALPEAGPGQILRFDTAALHAALDAKRRERGMTWKEVAGEIRGFTPGMLTNLAHGPLIGFPRVMGLTQWLGRPASDFVRVRVR